VLSGLGEAVPAVYGFIAARLKWNFSLLAALGASSGVQLAGATTIIAAASITKLLGPSGGTANRTPFGLIGEALGGKEFLLFGSKGERFSAIGTSEGFFSISH
jgi:hypothetical protein